VVAGITVPSVITVIVASALDEISFKLVCDGFNGRLVSQGWDSTSMGSESGTTDSSSDAFSCESGAITA